MGKPKYTVTFAEIRASLRTDRWRNLSRALGLPPTGCDPNLRFTLGDVAAFCGPADALWCVRLLPWPAARDDVLRALEPSVARADADAAADDDDTYADAYADAVHSAARAVGCAKSALAASLAATLVNNLVAESRRVDDRALESAKQTADILAVFGRLHAPWVD